MNNSNDKSVSNSKEEATTQILYDVLDEVLGASQDPDNHPAFEQLRQYLNDHSR